MSAAGGGKSKDPGLSGDALWDEIKKTIKPLRKAHARSVAVSAKKIEKSPPSPMRQKPAAQAFSPPPARTPRLPPLAVLDRRARGRIARGSTEIEGKLDLHGYQQAAAKNRLLHFLDEAQRREKSLVLVITGKGTVTSADGERGVLKRQVPLWLAQPEFRALVIGFEEAAPSHGGAGALYVRVRRRK